ncbi:hypothetical protein H6P81_020136 [Aristolochia fimbriata]|uniref:Pentatricopeptide repeat-containing protein n=1 Tax=Aristolochia fimbriata TaxID=158543 RepID=A0AAV7DUS4_ARIFI|nr:hypothetical protein H6P81_020136 [Aristolochia fimbriata]
MRNDGLQMPLFVYIGSPNRRSGLKLEIEPDILERHISVNMKSSDMYVMYVDGKLVVSNKALARVISEFIRVEKVTEISKLLIGIEKEICFPEKSRLSSDVVDTLVQLGWLEAAHDILDDLESAGVSLELDVYKLLVRTYSKEHKFKEAKVLLRQMRKIGWLKNFWDEEAISACLEQDKNAIPEYGSIKKSSLAYFLSIGSKEIDPQPPLSYEFNSSIHCFSKMIKDALKAFQKFQLRKLYPRIGLPQLSKAYHAFKKLDAKYLDAKIVFENKLRDAMFFQLSIEGWKEEVSINYQGPTNTYLNVAFNLPNGSNLFHKVLVIESRKPPADYMRELLCVTWTGVPEALDGEPDMPIKCFLQASKGFRPVSLGKLVKRIAQEIKEERPCLGQCLPIREAAKNRIKSWCQRYFAEEEYVMEVVNRRFLKYYNPAWSPSFFLDPMNLVADNSGRYLPPFQILTPDQEKDVVKTITRMIPKEEAPVALMELMRWRMEGLDPVYAKAVQAKDRDPVTGKLRVINPSGSGLLAVPDSHLDFSRLRMDFSQKVDGKHAHHEGWEFWRGEHAQGEESGKGKFMNASTDINSRRRVIL